MRFMRRWRTALFKSGLMGLAVEAMITADSLELTIASLCVESSHAKFAAPIGLWVPH